MELQRDIPAPIQESQQQLGSLAFWGNVVTTCQLTAVQILDDMVAVNFQADEQGGIPVPVLTWFFWARAALLVQAEQAMSEGPRTRDLAGALQIAQEFAKLMVWLAAAERKSAQEQNALRALHKDLTEAMESRPYHPLIADQTYGGIVASPRRIQLVQ